MFISHTYHFIYIILIHTITYSLKYTLLILRNLLNLYMWKNADWLLFVELMQLSWPKFAYHIFFGWQARIWSRIFAISIPSIPLPLKVGKKFIFWFLMNSQNGLKFKIYKRLTTHWSFFYAFFKHQINLTYLRKKANGRSSFWHCWKIFIAILLYFV